MAVHGGEDAAEVMQRYYALIGAGNYAEAYELREPAKGAPSAEAFAENFRRYAEYRATVAPPPNRSKATAGSMSRCPCRPMAG